MTEAEKVLWQHLLKRQLMGFKFRRQYGVGRYILDFYCPARRLCIEVDGAIHDRPDIKMYDRLREKYIESVNIKILRFSNDVVLNDISLVISKICETLSV